MLYLNKEIRQVMNHARKTEVLTMLPAPVTNNESTLKLFVTHITKPCLTVKYTNFMSNKLISDGFW
jgi:hypothetical protein